MTDARTALDETIDALQAAVQEREHDAGAHYRLGCAWRSAGRLELAQASFLKTLTIDPAFAPAALGLGQTLYDTGRSWEALNYLEQGLQGDPDNPDALSYCGRALADTGNTDLAVEFLRRAIEAAPGERRYALAAINVLQGIEFSAAHAWYEQFLIDCFDDAELPHAAIANVALSLLWIKPAMQQALAADRLDASHLRGLAQEPLLLRLLTRTIVRSEMFERFFTGLRLMLTEARDAEHLPLLAAVAEQAFNAGYVQYQTAAEIELEQTLANRGAAALSAADLMALACYRPLVDVPGAKALCERTDLPAATERVIRITLREPLRERAIESQIESLTPIHDTVSRQVQAQYEEHPYPHWIDIPIVDDRRIRLVEAIAQHSLNFRDPGWPERPRVLVPGCGTGYHPLSLASRHPEADVLAIDLSRTSLAYAIRKQQELQITNVRFCQADVLGLDDSSERFEYIDCAGVLHHMAAPLAGWKILTRLLEPGGVMRIGLYSELARSTIVTAREQIAALGIPSTPAAIRDFRRAILDDPALSALRSLAGTADFYSIGDVRDLLFHVQEHRFDLATIRRCLAELGLEFGGFLLANRDVVREFHKRYPAGAQWLDLDCWAKFEAQHPNTFYEMYQFYCLKPG